jgi:hypothetical protein
MSDWEFLLQKEGDRSWLPLESLVVEILEGRYRLMARSTRQSETVEVRVIHQPEDLSSFALPTPQHHVQQWQSQTNAEGLILLLPFSYLQPGLWEFSCRGDLMADLLGQGWGYKLQLDVLISDAEGCGEWSPEDEQNWSLTEHRLPEPELHTSLAALVIPEQSALPSAIDVPDLDWTTLPFDNLDVAGQDGQVIESCASASDSSALVPDRLVDLETLVDQISDQTLKPGTSEGVEVSLVLYQETFIVGTDHSIVLSGHIELALPVDDQPPTPLPNLEMGIYLRDPQTNHLLQAMTMVLPSQCPPIAFHHVVLVPQETSSHLLLGELVLYDRQTDTNLRIASQSFSVATQLEAIFRRIWQRSNHEVPSIEVLPPEDKLNLVFLNLVRNPVQIKPLVLETRQEWQTPPCLYSANQLNERVDREPELQATSKMLCLPVLPGAGGGKRRVDEPISRPAPQRVSPVAKILASMAHVEEPAGLEVPTYTPDLVDRPFYSRQSQRFWSRLEAFTCPQNSD